MIMKDVSKKAEEKSCVMTITLAKTGMINLEIVHIHNKFGGINLAGGLVFETIQHLNTLFGKKTKGKEIGIIYGIKYRHRSCQKSSCITFKGKVTKVGLYGNQLTSLVGRDNTELNEFYCNGNHQLKTLDVSNNIKLTKLECSENQLTSLDVSNCAALKELYCSGNQLTASALDALFETLHSNQGDKSINISNNPGTADCNRSIAEGKGWTVIDGVDDCDDDDWEEDENDDDLETFKKICAKHGAILGKKGEKSFIK